MINKVASIVERTIGEPIESSQHNKRLIDMGADSLDILEILVSIEDEFAIMVPDDFVKGSSTINSIANKISTQLEEKSDGRTHK